MAAATVVLVCIWLAMLLLGGGPIDRNIYETLYAGTNPALVFVARIFTFLGEPTVLIGAGLLVAAWLWFHGRGRLAIGLLVVILLGRGLSEVAEILDRASQAGLRTASRRRQDIVLPERSCDELDDLLPRAGTGACSAALASRRRRGRHSVILPDWRQPGNAGRPLAERCDRRMVLRPALGARNTAGRRAPVWLGFPINIERAIRT